MPAIERKPGKWAWWSEDGTTVVGWLCDMEEDGAQIVAVVRDTRDAQLLVDMLGGLDAR